MLKNLLSVYFHIFLAVLWHIFMYYENVKYLLLITFICFSAQAIDIQLGFGSLTPHFSKDKKNYCNQWNNTGIIANKTYYLRFMANQVGFTYLRGNDSICSPIEGMFIHYLWTKEQWYEIGMTLGGYSFEMSNWEKHARKTPDGVAAPDPVWTRVEGKYVVPVLALDYAIHLIRRDNWSLKLNNLFTPIIFNHSLAFEYRF